METLLAGLAFAVFLVAQIAAVVAVQAAKNDRQSPAADASIVRCSSKASLNLPWPVASP